MQQKKFEVRGKNSWGSQMGARRGRGPWPAQRGAETPRAGGRAPVPAHPRRGLSPAPIRVIRRADGRVRPDKVRPRQPLGVRLGNRGGAAGATEGAPTGSQTQIGAARRAPADARYTPCGPPQRPCAVVCFSLARAVSSRVCCRGRRGAACRTGESCCNSMCTRMRTRALAPPRVCYNSLCMRMRTRASLGSAAIGPVRYDPVLP